MDWQRFKFLQKETKKACKAAHNSYVADMICGDGNTKKVWKYIKGKRCDASGVAPLKKSGLVHSDPAAKANILNEQFCSVFTAEDLANMPDLGDSPYPDMPHITVTTSGI